MCRVSGGRGASRDVFPRGVWYQSTLLEKLSICIINKIEVISRVTYDLSSKPPATSLSE
ncbi:hypothetical protein ACFOJE_08545 [Azotobacter bryophylli]|uniref:GMP synthase C-terminal domain-containing protein n=1 Tax=Azotobacter bryophylli TaxID=1986537 RepID=A0ABV7ARV7_9GAMM